MTPSADLRYDIAFHWDPICPFAWMTSRWVVQVTEQRDYSVDWRFISLRILNKDRDYATEFPPEYPAMHDAGLRMLRVAAHVRAEHGRSAMGPLYTAYGTSIWDREPDSDLMSGIGSIDHIESVLAGLDLPAELSAAADDVSWDDEIAAETEAVLARTGRDVGTPIIQYDPPDGPALFGPIISRLPDDADAVELWDAMVTLARWPSFTEAKRSLREMPQLRSLGATGEPLPEQDWRGGRRA